jgi:hypothetical protein
MSQLHPHCLDSIRPRRIALLLCIAGMLSIAAMAQAQALRVMSFNVLSPRTTERVTRPTTSPCSPPSTGP